MPVMKSRITTTSGDVWASNLGVADVLHLVRKQRPLVLDVLRYGTDDPTGDLLVIPAAHVSQVVGVE